MPKYIVAKPLGNISSIFYPIYVSSSIIHDTTKNSTLSYSMLEHLPSMSNQD